MSVIGFIGAGVMGKSMVRNLMKAGYTLHVYSRTKAKAEELLEEGAQWQDSPGRLVKACDTVITIVGYPQDVEEVYLGADGLLGNAKEGIVLIDMTTSSPLLAERIAQEASSCGCHSLDAPVSGGDVGAREGRLSIMVGGDREVFERTRPVFEAMGQQIVYQGEAGAGQHTKMANQIAIASTMMGVCEALAYAEKAGLDTRTVMQSIESGAAGSWSLSNLGKRIIAEDYAPGFYIKHMIKDLGIALDSARELGLDTPGLKQAKALYEQLAEKGEADSGTQALIKWYTG